MSSHFANDDLLKEFYGPNLGYVLELYDRFRADPNSVDPKTRSVFEQWTPPVNGGQAIFQTPEISLEVADLVQAAAAAANLAHAIRTYGHLAAQLDPLGSTPLGDPALEEAYTGITERELRQIPAGFIGGPIAEQSENAWEALQRLREVYTSSAGYDYEHIDRPDERDWLRRAAEGHLFRPPQEPVDQAALLNRLIQVDALEQFLHRIFPGKTRFSIEGVDMLVPMLDELLGCVAEEGICTMVIGMAHRGRLNVLAHILGKPYAQILAEFKDPLKRFSTRDELGWTGDVKYHTGARHAVPGGEDIRLIVGMPPNPSHLEHIDPVVAGMARAAGSKVDEPGEPQFFTAASLPVMVHGDASFPGQGVVAETLNLSRLPGYWTGGTIHIIANNQIGYTTLPEAGRSTNYASDLAKGFEIPIIHVNADDPIACIEAVRTAFAYRQEFEKDFLIDLIGYRRFGHNEGDEPSFTQPRLYAVIEKHPPLRKLLAEQLIGEGLVSSDEPEAIFQQRMNELQEILAQLQPDQEVIEPQLEPPPPGAARQVHTAVPLEKLCELNESLLKVPEGFSLHRKLERAMQRRRSIFDDGSTPSIDWATAEELAFASILSDGVPIRLTGEDVARGTFSQRHAVFHDTRSGETFTPLQSIPQARASFEVRNSPLSENAALGFEFGYNIQAPRRLVVWEAQYGDFINAGQAIIDEFIVSARAKWEQTPSLVLLLPHGYEGQGPDHSTGRMERFLQMAAGNNMRLANCTTAAQYFHLLRRQAALLEIDPLPLIVFTPKSLLRNPLVSSPPRLLAESRWQPVIDDELARQHPEKVRRLILCSGKVSIDLIGSERRPEHPEVAILRVEQLYPFRPADLKPFLDGYSNLQEVIWLQEEPENMGAWSFVRPMLQEMLGGRLLLRYIGRPANSSPAEGSTAWHVANQAAIVALAFQEK